MNPIGADAASASASSLPSLIIINSPPMTATVIAVTSGAAEGQRVVRVYAAHEVIGAELRPPIAGHVGAERGDPLADAPVPQARRHLPGGAVDTDALLWGCAGLALDVVCDQVVPAAAEHGHHCIAQHWRRVAWTWCILVHCDLAEVGGTRLGLSPRTREHSDRRCSPRPAEARRWVQIPPVPPRSRASAPSRREPRLLSFAVSRTGRGSAGRTRPARCRCPGSSGRRRWWLRPRRTPRPGARGGRCRRR